MYETLWPLGKRANLPVAPAKRLVDLRKATIGEAWDFLFRGDEIFALIREELTRRYPGIRFVGYDSFGDIMGVNQNELVSALPQALKRHGCDAIISGVGA